MTATAFSGASTNISARRGRPAGPSRGTMAVRDALLTVIASDAGPWTVRQLFYRLSVLGAVSKNEAGYRVAQRAVLAMRRGGLIPYAAIADSTRWQRAPRTFDSLAEWAKRSTDDLRLNLWRDVGERVEVWCEKDALAGVLWPVTSRWHVPLMVTRGYSSESFAFSAAAEIIDQGCLTTIYYCGDLDPSGAHAALDLETRLRGFVGDDSLLDFVVLAVTPAQVESMRLPSRPTKQTDRRLAWFMERFGDVPSVELDAIPPDVLRSLVEMAIAGHLDADAIRRIQAEEDEAVALVRQIFGSLRVGAPS
jgi:hypothetical protein